MTRHARPYRTAAVLAGALVPAAVIAVTAAVYAARLPGALPVHWSGIGLPDRFAATLSVLWWTLGAAIFAAAAGIRAHLPGRSTGAGLVALAAGLGGVAGAVWLTAIVTTLAASGPADARLGWNILWISAGIAWAVAFGRTAGRDDRAAAIAAPPTGPRLAWVTVLRPHLFVTVPLVAAGTIVALAVTTEPSIWPAIALPLAALLLFSDLRVIVDRRGLRILAGPAEGPLSVPVKRIPLTDILAASAEHIEPLKWGGWGYRVIPGRSALVLRAGPGLVLELRNGSRFAVTVDDPETPAGVLTELSRSVG